MSYHKSLLIALLLGVSFIYIIEDATAQKNGIYLSFSNLKIVEENFSFEKNLPNLQLEYNRKILDYLSIGGYAGFGIFEEWECIKVNNMVTSSYLKYSSSLHYGINSKIHFLPFILKDGIPRFDLYVSGKAGIISINSSVGESIVPAKGNYFDYSFMGGGSFYLSKRFGLFIEAGYHNYKYYQGFNARYGLLLRF